MALLPPPPDPPPTPHGRLAAVHPTRYSLCTQRQGRYILHNCAKKSHVSRTNTCTCTALYNAQRTCTFKLPSPSLPPFQYVLPQSKVIQHDLHSPPARPHTHSPAKRPSEHNTTTASSLALSPNLIAPFLSGCRVQT